MSILTGLIANGIGDAFKSVLGSTNDKVITILEKAQKDYLKRYPKEGISKFDSFLFYEENETVLLTWIMNANIHRPFPELKILDSEEVTLEGIEFFFEKVREYIKEDPEIRSRASYELLTDLHKAIFDENSSFANNFVKQLEVIETLFHEVFRFTLWSSIVRLQEKNFLFDRQTNSTANCFNNIQTLLSRLNRNEFNKFTNIGQIEGLESLIELLKMKFTGKSHKINKLYKQKLKQIKTITGSITVQDKEYYHALGKLDIDHIDDEEQVYVKVMEQLIKINNQFIKLLEQELSEKSYVDSENKTTQRLSDHLISRSFVILSEYPETINYLKTIFEHKSITDVELAKIFEKDVIELRKELYPVLDLLQYNFNTNESTKLSILHYYRNIAHIWFEEDMEVNRLENEND
ncbi:hypothetical protein QNH39_10370 [Neobacillus novalis]|uniref:Uncharacterized protein n=1 Tax=Neobacillus novalis TaxID=220687 RepID=A0AA95SIT3_9BACI|nr:hypothetical protein [Neobacillus novalis]WHY88211.1 hypothetical protein QNH39_10370 [Neobacillus novalis]